MTANIDLKNNGFIRFFDHVGFGLKYMEGRAKNEGPEGRNIGEKMGDGLLWTVGALPRTIKWVGKQFQDPKVVTVALTITALFLATLAFYPTATIAAMTTAIAAIKLAAGMVPLWTLKLASYIFVCATITGYGMRAAGRFANRELMIKAYGLDKVEFDKDHAKTNPSSLPVEVLKPYLQQAVAQRRPLSDGERPS